jgi:hypothetical protein
MNSPHPQALVLFPGHPDEHYGQPTVQRQVPNELYPVENAKRHFDIGWPPRAAFHAVPEELVRLE